jgi:acyl-CoA reductase-like NAD-dependent aldehyde dehydrogenase
MEKTLNITSPIDGSLLAQRMLHGPRDIERSLSRAVKAQAAWRQKKIDERAHLLRKFVDAFLRNGKEISEELTRQMGRPITYAPLEVERTGERAETMIEIAATSLADIVLPRKPGFHRFIKREPLGVVFIIPAWNYPYFIAVNSIVPALMAGNAVILRHSALTPLCAERFFSAFESAGVPEGVFQYLHLDHENAARAIRDSRVNFVAYTGSVKGGHEIQKVLSERFVDVNLELGGKDPVYVHPDVNLEFAIENLVDGSFFNSGQSCCGVERIYVHKDVYNAFLEGFIEITNRYKLGNPLDPETTLGPMAKKSGADLVRTHIAEAVAKGARTLIDPKRFPETELGDNYLAPQVLVNVDHNMAVMVQESFGPVVGIMKVINEDEAVRLMNDSPYGLTASIWTQNEDIALRLGDRLETGTFYMNRCDYLDPLLAWVGVKDSGRGCSLSKVAYERLTRPKSYHLRIKTTR